MVYNSVYSSETTLSNLHEHVRSTSRAFSLLNMNTGRKRAMSPSADGGPFKKIRHGGADTGMSSSTVGNDTDSGQFKRFRHVEADTGTGSSANAGHGNERSEASRVALQGFANLIGSLMPQE